MTDTAVTVESEMERLSVHGNYDVWVEIVNAGQGGAQFFAAHLTELGWAAAARGRPFPVSYGFGSGDTVLAALTACERVALGGTVPGYSQELRAGRRTGLTWT